MTVYTTVLLIVQVSRRALNAVRPPDDKIIVPLKAITEPLL
jgi:hypothetical protein